MAASIVRDAAETTLRKEKHLVFEGVRTERPTMTEDDGLAGAPILVVNLGAISGSEAAHLTEPLYPLPPLAFIFCSRAKAVVW